MDRPPTDDLTRVFAGLAADPERWDFFAAVAAVEAADPSRPRVGEAMEPGQEAIDLEHLGDFSFPRTTIVGWVPEGRRPGLKSQHLGLTGPMGPMPGHITEITIFERARRGPRPLNEFFDLLGARPLQQFYRAWGNADPCANAARPADDHFAGWLGAVAGTTDLAFLRADAREEMGDGSHFDDWRRLPYGGHLAALRSPMAIGSLLSDLLGRAVTVLEAVGRWRMVPDDQRSRLGQADAALGRGATLGGRFWSVEFDVAFAIRARSMAELKDLLPGGRGHCLLAEAARTALPHHVNWRAHVAIAEHLISPARLGGRGPHGADAARLGWTSWMAPRGRVRVRHDLTIHERNFTTVDGPHDVPAMEDAA